MRVLITGASGFVGCRLGRFLSRRGHRVIGTFIRDEPEIAGVESVEVDILDADRLTAIVQRVDPEAIVHLAGLSHVGESWRRPADYFQVNVQGTVNLLRAASPEVRILVASSAEVYGAVPDDRQPITEEQPVAPQSPYAMTKAAMELLALDHDAIVVRSFNIVGPGQACSFALPAFARQLATLESADGKGEIRVGNLAARRDFVHVDDAVEALEILVETGEPAATYNLGAGSAVSIEQALEALIRVSGSTPSVIVDPERFRPVDLPLLQADNSRLRELGWDPTRDLDLALQDLWKATLKETSGATESDAIRSAD